MRAAVKKLVDHKERSAQPADAAANAVREPRESNTAIDTGLALIDPFGTSGIGLAFDMLSHDGVRELIRGRVDMNHMWQTAEMEQARGAARNALAAYDGQADSVLSAQV
eukprot:TRINITY_DN2168_c0_g1_i1.p1 TRINITY_DN2168_c0_g1~~TRINITY_DN2168_c0_g1_i1.p1  ORF type:complete len:109 (-),score=17.87 TRINITY_DN2168_c0_g1_i1:211-537(-)